MASNVLEKEERSAVFKMEGRVYLSVALRNLKKQMSREKRLFLQKNKVTTLR